MIYSQLIFIAHLFLLFELWHIHFIGMFSLTPTCATVWHRSNEQINRTCGL